MKFLCEVLKIAFRYLRCLPLLNCASCHSEFRMTFGTRSTLLRPRGGDENGRVTFVELFFDLGSCSPSPNCTGCWRT
jgi:hypothetical protein